MSRNHLRLHASRWQAVRRAVFERDGYRCVSCEKAGKLECDHVTPLKKMPGQNPYDPDGLQTLCRACHIAKTRRESRRALTPDEKAWQALVTKMLTETQIS